MCWISNKEPVKQIADKDIIVYKVLLSTKSGIYSPFQHKSWTLNKEEETEIGNPLPSFTCSKDWRIYTGFHSLTYQIPINLTGVWYNPKGPKLFYLDITDTNVYECIIPKGSIYYENEDGEVVSNKLTVIRKAPQDWQEVVKQMSHDFDISLSQAFSMYKEDRHKWVDWYNENILKTIGL